MPVAAVVRPGPKSPGGGPQGSCSLFAQAVLHHIARMMSWGWVRAPGDRGVGGRRGDRGGGRDDVHGAAGGRLVRSAVAAQVVPAAVALALGLGALRNGFAYDDIPIVRDNDWIRHGTALTRALVLPYWPTGALYRPVTSFSFAVDWMVGHGSPLIFHLVNILWYAAGTALVARLALRWWPPVSAAAAGLLFALHPVHVEAVANIVGRSELMAGAALLGVALLATAPGPASLGRLLGVALLSAAAYGCKETGMVAPVIVWAGALASRRDDVAAKADTRRLAIASLLGLALMIALRLQVLGTLGGDSPHPALSTTSAARALELALATIPRAVSLVLVPQLPRPEYSPTAVEIAHPAMGLVILGALLVLGGVAVLVGHARRPSPISFALLFSALTLAPVSNIVLHTGVVLAERTLYSPSIGTSLLMGAAVGALVARRRSAALAPVLLAGLTIIVAIGAGDAVASLGMWRDNASVFAAMLDRAPTSYRSYYMQARALQDSGRPRDAHARYRQAIALFGEDANMLSQAGVNAAVAGDTADAVSWLSRAVVLSPASPLTRTRLIMLDLRSGDSLGARIALQDGLAIHPDQSMWRALLDSLLSRAPDKRTSHSTRESAPPIRSSSAVPARGGSLVDSAVRASGGPVASFGC